MYKKTILSTCIMFFFSLLAMADEAEATEAVNENLWSTGKINIVLIVLGIIFLGIIFFLLHLDRKVARIERSVSEETK